MAADAAFVHRTLNRPPAWTFLIVTIFLLGDLGRFTARLASMKFILGEIA